MNYLKSIDQPTLVVNKTIACKNIQRMVDHAKQRGVIFRPHFKTHQSAQVGEWFRELGTEKITVSSVEMAEYFAAHGWEDITIAFSLNPRQVKRIQSLAEKVRLSVLVENTEALTALMSVDRALLAVWVKVDVGNTRTGVDWRNQTAILSLCQMMQHHPCLMLSGLLTHSGHTYHAENQEEVGRVFREGVGRLNGLQKWLREKGFDGLKISVGDTPGCSLCADWSGIDEVRPGNFVFYDAQQAAAGVCRFKDIAAVLACPVVAKHSERREVVIYGGAIHLSKDYLLLDGKISYGLPAMQKSESWGEPIPGAWVDRLSQEHGILSIPGDEFERIGVGDLVYIYPAHICLTVQVMREYYTLQGDRIRTL